MPDINWGARYTQFAGGSFPLVRDKIKGTIAAASAIEQLQQLAVLLSEPLEKMETLVTLVTGAEAGDENWRIAAATPFLSAMGHLVVGWLWLDQAVTVVTKNQIDRSGGKLWACRYFMEYELLRIQAWIAPAIGKRDLLNSAPAKFE